MANALNIKITGADKLQKKLQEAPKIAKREIQSALRDSALFLQSKAQQNAPVFSGELRTHIAIDVREFSASVFVDPEVIPYAKAMEYGLPANTVFPSYHEASPLFEWVRRKGIGSGEDIKQVTYLIARSIHDKGIQGRFYMSKAVESAQLPTKLFFEDALGRIEKQIAAQ